jgi:hypothetical protein
VLWNRDRTSVILASIAGRTLVANASNCS